MMLSDYTAGTISVAADGTAVTGVGTAWEVARFREGDWLIANGWVNVVASVDSNTSLTLAQPWRGGELSGASYRLRYMSDGSRASAQARQLIDMLGGSGNLEALGGLVGSPGSIPYFTGAGTMGLLSPQDITQGVHYDVQVDVLSGRDAYDGEPEGFAVLVSDVGDGRSAIYSRVGAAGVWSDPAYITGPVGPPNTLAKGDVVTGDPGTDADFSITGDAPNQTLNLTIPRGGVGPPNTLIKGTVTTGPAGSDADISITGAAPEQTLNITIPRGDKGEGLAADASVDTLADRDAYDDEPQGFTVLVRDIGNGRAAIFEKESAATADWSAPAYITGASGDGDVVGPATATDGAIAVFDGASGKLLKDGGQPIASLLPRDGSAAMTGPLVLTEAAAPATPEAGLIALYAKPDGKLYRKDDTGTEEEVGAGGGVSPTKQIFTSSGTWVKPAGCRLIKVTIVGGGASGAGAATTSSGQSSCGSGGGSAGAAIKWIDATGLTSETVTIGAGAAGVEGAFGADGGTTSFGAHCEATGGIKGTIAAATASFLPGSAGGGGGDGFDGDMNIKGSSGFAGLRTSGSTTSGGNGGSSIFGGGGFGATAVSGTDGGDGGGYGAGGGGAANGSNQSTARGGGAGADGICIVEEYY